jgi:predicted nuclease of predicted toxin-antitoxin system
VKSHSVLRFLLDESADARLGPFLRGFGHDVLIVAQDLPQSLSDREILREVHRQGRILITCDRDFGELVFAEGYPHAGVIYLRLGNSVPLETLMTRIAEVLFQHARDLDAFLVVTLYMVRIRRDLAE